MEQWFFLRNNNSLKVIPPSRFRFLEKRNVLFISSDDSRSETFNVHYRSRWRRIYIFFFIFFYFFNARFYNSDIYFVYLLHVHIHLSTFLLRAKQKAVVE